jgi:guanylate kinase
MEKAACNNQSVFDLPKKPLLAILSGPSGVGKDAVLARLKESSDYPMKYVITMTTRHRRENEKDDVDYHFVSIEKFQDMIEENELLEWANVYGNWYGVPKGEVKQALDQGQDVMVKVDIQGVANIKKLIPQAISIFLMPPSMEELITRLNQRRTESSMDLSLRLRKAEEEMKQLPQFDYEVVNKWDEIDRAVSDIKAIITAEKCRVNRREIVL